MVRALLLAGALSFSFAPFQCARTPDPNERREDSPGDALWELAQDFQAHHDDAAARGTLSYLVEKYPSSRYAPAAREALARHEPADGGK
jgi:hypothetical protein